MFGYYCCRRHTLILLPVGWVTSGLEEIINNGFGSVTVDPMTHVTRQEGKMDFVLILGQVIVYGMR